MRKQYQHLVRQAEAMWPSVEKAFLECLIHCKENIARKTFLQLDKRCHKIESEVVVALFSADTLNHGRGTNVYAN